MKEAFMVLRDKLTSPPALVFPDYNAPFIVETDASSVGVGAVIRRKKMERYTSCNMQVAP